MKGTVTQYVMLGVMFLLMVLIVSMYPEQNTSQVLGQKVTTSKVVSKLNIHDPSQSLRAD